MNYTFINAQGLAVGGGICQDADQDLVRPPDGCRVIWDVSPPVDFQRLWGWDGTRFTDQGPRFPETYATLRRDKYPAPGEQLDMLWHAMNAGTAPIIEPWYSDIKAIKDAYPKP